MKGGPHGPIACFGENSRPITLKRLEDSEEAFQSELCRKLAAHSAQENFNGFPLQSVVNQIAGANFLLTTFCKVLPLKPKSDNKVPEVVF